MPSHQETRILPYSAEQLFDLVMDIEKYPEFLPWCLGARINARKKNEAAPVPDNPSGFALLYVAGIAEPREEAGPDHLYQIRHYGRSGRKQDRSHAGDG